MNKPRNTFIEDNGVNFKITFKHGRKWVLILLLLVFLSLCIGSFISPAFIVIDIIFLPALVIFILINLLNKTVITIDSESIVIIERKRLFSDRRKIAIDNIIKVYLAEQLYVEKNTNAGPTSIVDYSSSKSYKQAVIGIQSTKRVFKFGHQFSDKQIQFCLSLLKEKLMK